MMAIFRKSKKQKQTNKKPPPRNVFTGLNSSHCRSILKGRHNKKTCEVGHTSKVKTFRTVENMMQATVKVKVNMTVREYSIHDEQIFFGVCAGLNSTFCIVNKRECAGKEICAKSTSNCG